MAAENNEWSPGIGKYMFFVLIDQHDFHFVTNLMTILQMINTLWHSKILFSLIK